MLIINASPRKKGNIAQMVAEMSEEAKNHGVEAEVVEVQNLNVRPCMGCMQCRSKRRCVLTEDDAGHVLQQIRECEALVIATPCYWGNIPGTLKVLFDRIVSTSTTPWPLNILFHQSHGAIRALREICHYSGFKIVATIEKGGTKHNTVLTSREKAKCRKAIRKLLA